MCDQLITKTVSSEVRESTLFDQRCSTMLVALQTFCVCFLVLLGRGMYVGVQSNAVIVLYSTACMEEAVYKRYISNRE